MPVNRYFPGCLACAAHGDCDDWLALVGKTFFDASSGVVTSDIFAVFGVVVKVVVAMAVDVVVPHRLSTIKPWRQQ